MTLLELLSNINVLENVRLKILILDKKGVQYKYFGDYYRSQLEDRLYDSGIDTDTIAVLNIGCSKNTIVITVDGDDFDHNKLDCIVPKEHNELWGDKEENETGRLSKLHQQL